MVELFVYFGLTKFLWHQMEVNVSQKKIFLSEPCLKKFKKEIENDVKALRTAGFVTKKGRWAAAEGFIKVSPELDVRTYQHGTHVSCSDARYECFKLVFSVTPELSLLDYVECSSMLQYNNQ